MKLFNKKKVAQSGHDCCQSDTVEMKTKNTSDHSCGCDHTKNKNANNTKEKTQGCC